MRTILLIAKLSGKFQRKHQCNQYAPGAFLALAATGLDAKAIPDPMRDDYQWLSVGGNYASDSWWLPGAWIGARRNLVGTELTYVTAGVTLFNVLNIDLASTVETISINDQTRPRGLIANIGFNVLFQDQYVQGQRGTGP